MAFLLFVVLNQNNKLCIYCCRLIIAIDVIVVTDLKSKVAACSVPTTDMILQRLKSLFCCGKSDHKSFE